MEKESWIDKLLKIKEEAEEEKKSKNKSKGQKNNADKE